MFNFRCCLVAICFVGTVLSLQLNLYAEVVPAAVVADWRRLHVDIERTTGTLRCVIASRERGREIYRGLDTAYLADRGKVLNERECVQLQASKSWLAGEVSFRNGEGEYGIVKNSPEKDWRLEFASPLSQGEQLDFHEVYILFNLPIRIAGHTILDLVDLDTAQIRKWEALPSGNRQVEILVPEDVERISGGTYLVEVDPSHSHRLVSWVLKDGSHLSKGRADYEPGNPFPKKYHTQYGIESGIANSESVIETTAFDHADIPSERFTLEHYGIANVVFATRRWPWALYVSCVVIGSVLLYFSIRASRASPA